MKEACRDEKIALDRQNYSEIGVTETEKSWESVSEHPEVETNSPKHKSKRLMLAEWLQ